MTSNSAGH